MFKVGDKVVFLPEAKKYFSQFSFYIHALKNDETYTVRGTDKTSTNCRGIYLEGIYNENFCGAEMSYNGENFRKVEDNFAEQILESVKEQIEQEQQEQFLIQAQNRMNRKSQLKPVQWEK